ncbi:MAG: type II CAAX endopeptidase family protein [Bacillota bacterium]
MELKQSEQFPVVPWTIRDIWLGMACLVLLMVGASLTVVLSVGLNSGLLLGLMELSLLVPVGYFALWKYKGGWGSLGLGGFTGRAVGLGYGLFLLSYVFNVVYSLLLSHFHLRMQTSLAPLFSGFSFPWWLLVVGVVVAPVVEEIFFRGFVFGGMRKKYGWRKAALISSAFFAVIHLEWTAFLPIFILGCFFAYLYHRSNSIWPAILVHASTNAWAMGAAYWAAKTGIPGLK